MGDTVAAALLPLTLAAEVPGPVGVTLPPWAGPSVFATLVIMVVVLIYRGVLWTKPAVRQMKDQYEMSIVRIREDANRRAEEALEREKQWRDAYMVAQHALVEANEAIGSLTEVGHTANDLIKALRRTVDST